MQFLWKYVDDLIGKGLEFNIILELLWYSTITLIPIALPLAVLLASMMLMGGLAEKSEVTAMNSLGQPFTYLITPLFVFSLFIAGFSFIISNYAIPYSNLKATNLMYDIMQKKLNINIKEKVFFSEIEGYSIRVNKKENDGIMNDVIIYDYSEKKGVKKIFTASQAKMSTTKDNNYLVINLYNGQSYQEVNKKDENYTLLTEFDQYNLTLDLSSFKMERTDSDRFTNRAKTMNTKQLKAGIDSLHNLQLSFKKDIYTYFNPLIEGIKKNYTINQKIQDYSNYKNQKLAVTKKINKFKVELHRKLTLAIACILMLTIGASIGAIIRKGGFGLPVIFSIILFLLYHVISITGEKMVKKDVLEPIIGMWGSTYIMIIISFILIILVNNSYFQKAK